MSSKQRRIKRKLNIIAKVYRQYERAFWSPKKDGGNVDRVFLDQEHRALKLHDKHGERVNLLWAAIRQQHGI